MNQPKVHREIERKLEVPSGFRLPRLAGTVASVASSDPQPVLHLEAVYFDTADLRLARSHITLRRRTGGNDDGWHLKLPVQAARGKRGAAGHRSHADAASRDELQLPLGASSTDAHEPPWALVSAVLGVTRGAVLAPVATIRNQRRPTHLVDADGRPIAEITDDRVTVLRSGRITERFREIEVEAAAGRSVDDLEPIVAALVDAGATISSFSSKAARALGPGATDAPDIATPPKVGVHDPAADAIRAHLARHTAALVREDLNVRRGLPEGVHQMRVAARRLRSGIRVFGPLLDQEWSRATRDELGWIARELGAARDREVLEARLLQDLAALPIDDADVQAAADVVRRVLGAEALDAAARSTEAMESERYLALLDRLVSASAEPPVTDAASRSCAHELRPLVRAAWRKFRRDAEALRKKSPDDQWHAVRIRGKHTRYALDALTPVFGRPAREWAKQVATVTELLGMHQDAALAADTARLLAAEHADGSTGFVFGLLHDAERAHVTAARRQFKALWPEVAHPRWRRWLRAHH